MIYLIWMFVLIYLSDAAIPGKKKIFNSNKIRKRNLYSRTMVNEKQKYFKHLEIKSHGTASKYSEHLP